MTRHELDPLDELRRSDPAPGGQVPSASLARIRARVQENIVQNESSNAARLTPRRRWLVGLAAGGAFAAIALALTFGQGGSPPGRVPGDSGGGPVVGSCVEQYNLASLGNREWAFDGTVTEIADERVTFAVNELFKGSVAASVTLDAPGMTGTAITSGGGPTLTVGGRYLVAGEDTFVWGCGFTQSYDPTTAADWADALGS